MRFTTFGTLLLLAALCGCDGTRAVLMTRNSPSEGPRTVSIPSEVRKNLEDRFDVDALEELLALMSPAEREPFLVQLGLSESSPPSETTDVTLPLKSTDPVRQAILDRMWAPFWAHLSPDALDREDLPFPGRELARARRDAANSGRRP